MAYLGNVPARSFISFERQVFTIVNSQTAYTLSHSVANENDIRLVVNNVVQEPGSGKAYTATGTALTLSAALTNGTDEMYCVFLGRAVETVKPPAGSVSTSQLADDAVTTAKILNSNITVGKMAANSVDSDQYVDASIDAAHLNSNTITGQTAETSIATDDLILLSDTSASGALKKMTRANFVSGIGGSNSSQFSAYGAAGQTLSTNTYTKINIVNEFFDVDSDYDASNSKFVAPSAGKYFLYGQVAIRRTGTFTGNPCQMTVRIYKNGSGLDYIGTTFGSTDGSRVHTVGISAIVNASASDYFEVYGRHDKGSDQDTGGESLFEGFKLIS